jgi:hypothetical protein
MTKNNSAKDSFYLYAPQKLVDQAKQLYLVISDPGSVVKVNKVNKPITFEEFLTYLMESGIVYISSDERSQQEISGFSQNVATFIGAIHHKEDVFDIPVKVAKDMYDYVEELVNHNANGKIIEENKKTKKKIEWVPDQDTLRMAFSAGFIAVGYEQFLTSILRKLAKIGGINKEDAEDLVQ